MCDSRPQLPPFSLDTEQEWLARTREAEQFERDQYGRLRSILKLRCANWGSLIG
jgi:hypothetical protein